MPNPKQKEKARRRMKMQSARKAAQTDTGGRGGQRVLKVPEGMKRYSKLKKAGRYRIDIIPFVAGEGNLRCDPGIGHYEKIIFVHHRIGPREDSVVCVPQTVKNSKERCAVCEYQKKLRDKGQSWEDTSGWNAQKMQALYVRDRDDDETKDEVQYILHPYFNFGEQLDAKINGADPKEDDPSSGEYDDFADPDVGYSLKLVVKDSPWTNAKTGKSGKNTKVVDIEFKDRQPLEDALLKVPCLDDLLIKLSYEEMKQLLLQSGGTDDNEDGVDDHDDEDAVSRNGPTAKQVPQDEEDEDEEDDEDEEIVPVKTAKKPAKLPTAEEFSIEVGDDVKVPGKGVCEVINISPDGTSLKVKDSKGKVHLGVAPEDVELVEGGEDPEEEEPKPAKKPTDKSKPSKARVPEPDEEDEDEDEEDDDFDDAESDLEPLDEEDEDDDLDDEDEDEEDEPSPQAKKTTEKPGRKK